MSGETTRIYLSKRKSIGISIILSVKIVKLEEGI